MQLTPEQQKKIQDILDKYKTDVDRVVEDFREQAKQKLEELDKQKMEEIKKLISN